jgi:hypothetical protein
MRAKIFVLVLFGALLGKAQTYSVSPAKTVTFTAALNNITIHDIFQTNTGTSKIVLKWELITINLPPQWNYSMCDYATCYSSIPAGPNTMDSVAAGAQGFLGLNIDPGTTDGTGFVKVFVYQDGFKPNGDTLTWHVKTPAVSVEEIYGNSGIKIFPNPVVHTLSVDLGNYEISSGTITDVSGRKVMDLTLNPGHNKIDVSHLAKGFYVLLLDTEDKQLFKRISVE